ncbi:hypothetical protein Acr_03g0002670 [Actinidia rufa]|uniref:Uncharacterized protein n=1 Tax=Actinidia rufa TaxID=165716 RepID=A0A7J0EAK7_9ERIC|nr:hypothetical protein Acr_03g0002670 [Actinidia rufa]
MLLESQQRCVDLVAAGRAEGKMGEGKNVRRARQKYRRRRICWPSFYQSARDCAAARPNYARTATTNNPNALRNTYGGPAGRCGPSVESDTVSFLEHVVEDGGGYFLDPSERQAILSAEREHIVERRISEQWCSTLSGDLFGHGLHYFVNAITLEIHAGPTVQENMCSKLLSVRSSALRVNLLRLARTELDGVRKELLCERSMFFVRAEISDGALACSTRA